MIHFCGIHEETQLTDGGECADCLREAYEEDICGLCGNPGADKYAHPVHWPGEAIPDGPLVHASCENEECRRAHSILSDKERVAFLRTI